MSFAARTGAIAGVGARALTPRRARGSRSQARGGSPAPACVTNASTALGTWTPTPDGLRRRARCHAVDSTAGLLASMDEQDPPPIDAGADLDGVVILNGSVDDPETGASATTSIDDDDDDDEPIFSGELFARLVRFTLPTMAIWLSGPILSMVDTAVVGTASTLELAAMTPGGVYVDYPSYLLSSSLAVATTTLVAQERMRKKKKTRVNAKGELEDGEEDGTSIVSDAVALAALLGLVVAISLSIVAAPAIAAFAGPKSAAVVPAALTYAAIRCVGVPFQLVASVAQASFLACKSPWQPLIAVACSGKFILLIFVWAIRVT